MRPAPPESIRYSLRQITTGAIDSMISTGTLFTPLGNAVADKPSLLGRAPVPRAWNESTLNGVPPATLSLTPCPPRSCGTHSADAPSAGAPLVSAWRRQPNTTSGSMWPITWRMATAQGRGAFKIEPSGALTVIGASEPALFGMPGATRHFTPNAVYAVV